MKNLKNLITDITNFPKQGIVFKDIAPLLANPNAFAYVIDKMAQLCKEADIIVAPDARGFIFGTPVAYKLNKPFIMVRKKGKLPGPTISQKYDLEYGDNTLEIQDKILKPGQKAIIIDDVLATGGTTKAIIDLLQSQGVKVLANVVLMVLNELDGYKKISKLIDVKSIL
ncbi:adenine phosphoribosyltransferase [Mycoplasma sp. 4404]|uniref:adenine phosphoribosyltransferase n=1 Tax=Mycoplasma sp. 4404 TaxID=3108530 RepID=UPI002B1DCBF2|nr:adenine phosphoribosyltransferase [Mycoplasma sp. 4404]MEA4162706.1 adenine phosphoribosyltransferase [Mycoplasma sp. 4404]